MATPTQVHEIKREQENMILQDKALADDVVEAVAALHLVDRVPEMTSDVQIRPCLVTRSVRQTPHKDRASSIKPPTITPLPFPKDFTTLPPAP